MIDCIVRFSEGEDGLQRRSCVSDSFEDAVIRMRRWFLSYSSQDLALAQAFEAALRRKEPDADVYFVPKSVRAGAF
jgi:hypothetical protein